ncbi:acetyl-CoA acetyltransferase [Subtercola boreus]|uniref:Probable acetyl-CoA acetyltransferase n=1 Tax=Subtercola boreus TaxID=120213 RepID=A0A3E0VLI9_9MICO|nr:acetyl-CoA C-acyltransferase [Subtercola boreus]RFA10832.1 acetyl-CoA acetyltransferase [Subtercola boreus]TQL55587.1 acetyl-CoA C-acetyltransferase [Subtercola boreus]
METSVIVAGARTPIGKLLGTLSTLTAPELGGIAIRAAVERAGIDPGEVDAVTLGNVVQAGVGANPARQAAIAGGVPLHVPATTLNKLCLSGLAAIGQTDLAIRAGFWNAAIAGGIESMSNAPHLLRGARTGFKYGSTPLEDSLDRDALICSIDNEVMGAATDHYQRALDISRAAQDEFSARSHQRAAEAIDFGRFGDEIVPVTISSRRGETVVDTDEGVRRGTTSETLSTLRPAFGADGTITAGSASQLSDGGAALIVMSKSEAERRGLSWLAEIVSYGTVSGPDPSLLLQPAGAIRDALRRQSETSLGDLAVLEMNEAFASVAIASSRQLGVDVDLVNPNGGAIALGHPVGMSGARLVLTLAMELRRRGGGYGAAALCGGGGQGDALIIRVP